VAAVSAAPPSSSLVIVDTPSFSSDFSNLVTYVSAGGRAILSYWYLEGYPALAAAFQAVTISDFGTPLPVYDWGGSSLFSGVGSPLTFQDTWGIDGDRLQPTGNAQALAGFVSASANNQAAIILGNSGRTLLNGFLNAEVYPTNASVQFARNEIQLVVGGVSPPNPPSITSQPVSLSVAAGFPAAFNVTAVGAPPLAYQWSKNGYSIGGATNSNFTLPSALPSDAGTYAVIVTNFYGSVTSAPATLTVLPPANSYCTNAIVITGSNYTNTQSTVGAPSTGDPLPTCGSGFGSGVWYRFAPTLNGKIDVDTIGSDFDTILAVYSGSCGALVQLSCDDDGGVGVTSKTSVPVSAGETYYILAGGYGGDIGNLVLHLLYNAAGTPPIFFSQPVGLTKASGATASFSVTLGGSLPFYYQWRLGGLSLAGATNNTYTIASVQTSNAGLYSVMVTNPYGSALSSNALLTVLPPPAYVFLADFENGNNGFTYSAGSNLWHRTTHRFTSTNHSQYYGIEGIWTYDNGASNSGTLQSPTISLATAVSPITLSFNYFLQTEVGTTFDLATLSLSYDGGATWNVLATRSSANPLFSSTNTSIFTNWVGDISAYAGRQILLRFNFNTLDQYVNDYEGWYVDDVAIIAASYQPVLRLRPPNFLSNRALEFWLGRDDGLALTGADVARVHVYSSTNLTLPTATWQEITSGIGLSNGLLHVGGLSTSNNASRFFRAMETP
jgi:hypothetical protein